MNIWTKRVLIVLSVGGGFLGAVLMTSLFPQAQGRVVTYMLIVAMMAVFLFGVFCGLRFIEDEAKGLRLLRWFYGIQIPLISSPIFAYQLSSGAAFNVSLGSWKINLFWRLGSEMGLWFLQDRPWGIGVNIFALAVFIWINRLIKKNAKVDMQSPPTPTS